MELTKYVACICEGSAENAIITAPEIEMLAILKSKQAG